MKTTIDSNEALVESSGFFFSPFHFSSLDTNFGFLFIPLFLCCRFRFQGFCGLYGLQW
ncbi:hypothetical protein ES319_A02G029400v1 [Gossypium barbadense]|uniref:Uncharacterized protein n=1 Tax=Gossypium barbadense TaxID=3634 RepID=A0A5J5WKN3_GOSBA|nr:hypothetical protein ES319_A02G029400v1 [Gossypium barbadense]